MRTRFFFLLRFYAACLLLFGVAKPLFMLFNGAAERGVVAADYWQVPAHGASLDLATTGYLAVLPWLGLLLSFFVKIPKARLLWKVYSAFLAAALSFILVGDPCLYSFWDFKVDSTVFLYITSPEGVTQSVSWLYLLGFSLTVIAVALVFYLILVHLVYEAPSDSPLWGRTAGAAETSGKDDEPKANPFPLWRRLAGGFLFLLIGGLMFLGIRGGVGRSTANVGMVYYSEKQFLNHSAVNPAFSLFSSIGKNDDFAAQGNYFEEAERKCIFESLKYHTDGFPTDTLLTTPRPNVLIVLMEGMGAQFVEAIGGMPNVTPNLNALAAEGVVFTRCYANSYRTDRGTVCTLSGYPSFPNVSVMKVASKSRHLPGIAASLKREGYATDFLYGGDVNFTNMKSYLLSTGYEQTCSDDHFPLSVRRTHAWGVTDSIVFDRLIEMIARRDTAASWHTTLLTLASHEPWRVPHNRFPDDKVVNAMSYLDACIGRFMAQLRTLPQWKNTLVVFIPDHGVSHPNLTELDLQRYHIPMIWAGGAVKQHRKVDLLCNQTDLAATLLGQMGIAHDDFRFSRDVLSTTYEYPCAVHTWAEGITFIDTTGVSIFDLTSQRTVVDTPEPSVHRVNAAKAFLQTGYDDLGALK